MIEIQCQSSKISVMKKIILLLVVISGLFGCKENESVQYDNYNLHGHIQKGPFLTGTDITVYELNNNLNQTGKSFNSTVIDDKGTFDLWGVNLTSEYILVKATGSYYHEILNAIDAYQITLYSICNVDSLSPRNVNIMTHLEKERITNLVKSGISPQKAFEQANFELLKVFNLEKAIIFLWQIILILQ